MIKPRKPLPDKLFAPKERDIERACSQLLQLDNWRVIVTDPPQLRGLGVSEKGIPDRLFLRYYPNTKFFARGDRDTLLGPYSACEVLWCEFKRPGGKASAYQKAWHLLERKRGALVILAGQDFPASYEGFLDWYRGSGLNRRPI